MILHCNYEELGALKQGARALLGESLGGEAPVAAPPEGCEEVSALLPLLTGDLTIDTLAEQRLVTSAISFIVDHLKEEMDSSVTCTHPADETAVSSYFLYAHALAVQARLGEMGEEMEALIEVMTGAPPTQELVETFHFPG